MRENSLIPFGTFPLQGGGVAEPGLFTHFCVFQKKTHLPFLAPPQWNQLFQVFQKVAKPSFQLASPVAPRPVSAPLDFCSCLLGGSALLAAVLSL